MADSSDPETAPFPQIQGTPQTSAFAETGAPKSAFRRSNGPIFTLLGILALIIILAAIWLFMGLNSGSEESSAPATPVIETSPTLSEQASETAPEAPSEVEARPAHPSMPSGASPANDAAASNSDAGNLNNVYSGSSATSPEFANAVRDAFVNNYLDSGELNAQVEATSPITGESYTMTCEDSGEFITCKGGNNAVVYIS